MCSKEFCADFHCEILPIETEKHGRMNPTKKTVSTDFLLLQIWVWLSVKIQQKGFCSGHYFNFHHKLLQLYPPSSDWFDVFFSEHMNNKIKGDSCFWIGNHLGMVLIKHFPLTFLLCWPYSFSLWFYFSMSTLRALLTGSISTLTFSLLNFTSLFLDNPFPLWLWESLVRLPWFVWHQPPASRNLPVPW